MNNSKTNIITNRYDKAIVVVMVVLTIWSLFTGLGFFFGGILWQLTGGKINVMVKVSGFVLSILLFALAPRTFQAANLKYALPFTLALLIIYAYTRFILGITNNDLMIGVITGVPFILLRDDLKVRSLDALVRVLASLLLLSMVEYALYVLTGFGIITSDYVQRGEGGGNQVFHQLILNFISAGGTDMPRFQFLCEEPGLIGTFCGFVIFALRGKPQYRFHYVVFIVAGLLSFSLAYYVILALHVATSGLKFGRILAFVIIAVVFYMMFKNFFDTLIFERTQRDDVDNRVNENFDLHFFAALRSGNLWFGHGSIDIMMQMGGGNAGGKVWIWNNGILGFIMVFAAYTYYYFGKVRQYATPLLQALAFFAVFWISFYQRQNITFMDYLIVFMTFPMFRMSVSEPNRLVRKVEVSPARV